MLVNDGECIHISVEIGIQNYCMSSTLENFEQKFRLILHAKTASKSANRHALVATKSVNLSTLVVGNSPLSLTMPSLSWLINFGKMF